MDSIDSNTPATAEPGATDKIAAALAKAQLAYKKLTKSRTAVVPTKAGGKYSYNYADLSDVVECAREALAANQIAWIQSEQAYMDTAGIATFLLHASGQGLESWTRLVGDLMTSGPQAHGSALTYTRRYGLCLALGIVAEEDDDAQAAQGVAGGKAAPQKAPVGQPASKSGESKGVPEKRKPLHLSEKQMARLFAIKNKAGWPNDEVKGFIQMQFSKASSYDLNLNEYEHLCSFIEEHPIQK